MFFVFLNGMEWNVLQSEKKKERRIDENVEMDVLGKIESEMKA